MGRNLDEFPPIRPENHGLCQSEGNREKFPRLYGGEGGIRTPGTGFSQYNGLANRRLQPLGHLSAVAIDGAAQSTSVRIIFPPPASERSAPHSLVIGAGAPLLGTGNPEQAIQRPRGDSHLCY